MSAGNGFSGAHGDRRQRGSPGGSACSCAIRNTTTRDCILGLDTTRDSPQNPCNFSVSFLVQGARVEKGAHRSRGCWLYFTLNAPARPGVEPAGIKGEKRAVFARLDRAMY